MAAKTSNIFEKITKFASVQQQYFYNETHPVLKYAKLHVFYKQPGC